MQHIVIYSPLGMCYDAYVYAAPRWRMTAAHESTRTISHPVVIPSTPLWQIVAMAVIELIISLVI